MKLVSLSTIVANTFLTTSSLYDEKSFYKAFLVDLELLGSQFAFMQAVGMINAHQVEYFRFNQVS